ncbi:MAG: PAS domain S-box protein [Gaiellales bacterium]|nr:MAG: PAS domain S-box protein [Gaiellales bacterium]
MDHQGRNGPGSGPAEEEYPEVDEISGKLLVDGVIGCFSFGSDGVLRWGNQRAAELLGCRRSSLRGKAFTDLCADTAAGRQKAAALLEGFRRGEQIRDEELQMLRSDGTSFWISLNIKAVADADGRVTEGSATVTDISSHKRTEETLKRNFDSQRAIGSILQLSLGEMDVAEMLVSTLDLLFTIPWLAVEAKGSISLVDEEDGSLIMAAERGLSVSIRKACTRIPSGYCLCGRAAATGALVYASDIDDRHDILYEGITPHGHYCIPMISRGRVIGVLNCYLEVGHERDDEEVRFLSSVANVLAGVIERRRAEDALAVSEKRFRDIANNALEWIWEVDTEGRYTYSNPIVTHILGYQPEELLGMHFYDLFHPDDREEYKELAFESFAAGNPFHQFLNRNVSKGGEVVWLSTSGVPLVDSEGNLTGYRGADTDVTERIHAEEELRRSEQYTASLLRLSKALEQSRSAADIVHAAYPEVREVLGYNSTWIGFGDEERQKLHLLFQQGDVEDFVEMDTEFRVEGDVWLEEMVRAEGPMLCEDARTDPRTDKERVAAEGYRTMLCVPIRLMDGSLAVLCTGTFGDEGVRVPTEEQIRYFTSMASSIAVVLDRLRFLEDRERVLGELRMSEQKYRTLFEESRDAVFTSDPDGCFIDVNPAAVVTFGYPSEDELLAAAVDGGLFTDDEDRRAIKGLIQEQGFVNNYELAMRDREGQSLIVSMTANAMHDEGGRLAGYRGIIRDMTELRRLEQQLVQAQKMECVGRLAGGVSHDLNNYLTAIQGYTDLAISELPEGSAIAADLKEARRSSDRATALTRQLLLFSRQEPMEKRTVELDGIIGDLVKMLGQLVGEQYSLNIKLSKDLAAIRADAGYIEQVIMNLVVNARDAMPDGGRITIGAANVNIGEDYARRHPGSQAGNHVCLKVADEGMGMDDNIIGHIFEPFFSTKESSKGTGLGLAVVHGIVSQHGGWIEVESAPGEGSVFKVFLPAAAGRAQVNGAGPAADAAAAPGQGERILLVEDDQVVRTLTRRMLERSGYSVSPAVDAEEALELFARENGDFRLVLSDVVLPGESGVQLVDRLVAQRPDLGVLLMSGYSDESRLYEIRDKGYAFIRKPFAVPRLVGKIQELI